MTHVATYTYGFDDYLATVRAKRAISRFGRYRVLIRYGFVALVFLVVLLGLTKWGQSTAASLIDPGALAFILGGLVAVAILIALIDLLFERILYRLVFRRFALANSPLTITLDDAGIRWSGQGIAADSQWSRVKQVHVNKDRLFLFFSKIEAICVPRRGFASDAEYRDMVAYASARVPDAGISR